MPIETPKDKARKALKDVMLSLDNARKSGLVEDFKELPDTFIAFQVVAKHLPLLLQTLRCMRDRVKGGMTQEYAAVHQLTEACRARAGNLQNIFTEMKSVENPNAKMTKYRAVVSQDGTRVEDIMRGLLAEVTKSAVAPLVSDDLIKQLQDAKTEVDALEPSIKENQGGVVMTQLGNGIQPLHTGVGSQNNCSGGVQNNGSNATNHFGPESNRQ
ncbi:uncharacterized protein F4822DRAFT_418546 [Hypoxylon trugodes]|uniref:uncharacterized protein n=1 Tax=Hypoxylon trugodes TaxID=326681 RepID=UPI0021A0EDD3|nr:uncharacterized protein F4822DRAFT_418546 [Hypoxylon trugodes]KAI1384073.1 hypothetical protein F4822DRAFT_418546 [Hypoxylon trugodes]